MIILIVIGIVILIIIIGVIGVIIGIGIGIPSSWCAWRRSWRGRRGRMLGLRTRRWW
jgi:hypothetical protein